MKHLYGIVACIFMMLATACNHHHEGEAKVELPPHTLLIYMAGDNSLSGYCKENIQLIKEGLLDSEEDINLIIYKDNRDGGDALPSLFQLKRSYDKKTNRERIDTVMIETYSIELDSTDPKVFADIVKKTFSIYDTEVKGLEIWSHGMSWIPSDSYVMPAQPKTKGLKYFGQDDRHFMELWDLRQALESCPHLDYISFDACFAGMAEVACELNSVCDYIYGPITEIMGSGFPYDTMLPILARCQSRNTVQRTLCACVDDFMECYTNNGTITVLSTANAVKLAKAVAKLRAVVPEKLEAMNKDARNVEAKMQHYGRSCVATRYLFYEFEDMIDYLSANGNATVKSIVKEIDGNNIVVYHANSDRFDDGAESLDLKGCQGLGVSIPEFFQLESGLEKRLNYTYGLTVWGKTLGF